MYIYYVYLLYTWIFIYYLYNYNYRTFYFMYKYNNEVVFGGFCLYSYWCYKSYQWMQRFASFYLGRKYIGCWSCQSHCWSFVKTTWVWGRWWNISREHNTGIWSDSKLVTWGKLLKNCNKYYWKNNYLLTKVVDEVVNYSISLHAQKDRVWPWLEIYVYYCSKLPLYLAVTHPWLFFVCLSNGNWFCL